MRQADEAELPTSGAQARKHHACHLRGYRAPFSVCRRQCYKQHSPSRDDREQDHTNVIWYGLYEVGRKQFREKGWNDIAEEDDALGHGGANEVECGGEDDHVEDVVDETYVSSVLREEGGENGAYRRARKLYRRGDRHLARWLSAWLCTSPTMLLENLAVVTCHRKYAKDFRAVISKCDCPRAIHEGSRSESTECAHTM